MLVPNWLQRLAARISSHHGFNSLSIERRRVANGLSFRRAMDVAILGSTQRVEELEHRVMLTVPSDPPAILGTASNDIILVEPDGQSQTDVVITVNGVTSGPFRPSSPISIAGLEGADLITVSPSVFVAMEIDGGPGSDTIQGGSGDDFITSRDSSSDIIDSGLGLDKAPIDSLDFYSNIEFLNPRPNTPENQTQHVKVLVLNFDPIVPTEGDRHLYDIFFGWSNPRSLATGYETDLERASGGAVNFDVVEWRDLNEIPAFEDGFRYTTEQYVANRRTGSGWHAGRADFPAIVAAQNIASLINNGTVDEVWMFGDHFFALPGESWMAGPGAFYINGPTYPQIPTTRAFACMGFSYERGVAEMLHNNGHRTESTMNRVYGGWNLANPMTNWDRFSANYQESNGVASVGTTHWPANAAGQYDTSNPRIVQSWADDYLNYPNLTGATMSVNAQAWSKGPDPNYERDYQNWYFSHLPRAAGINADGHQNNWWKYLYDFNNYTPSGQPKSLTALVQASDLYNLGDATYSFTVAYSSPIPIDVSTIDGNDIRITRPNGFSQLATVTSLPNDSENTHYLAVTYSIVAPGGTWDSADLGSYTLTVQADQIKDTLGNVMSGDAFGTFNVKTTNATPLANDAATTFLLHLDESLNGAAGQTAVESTGTNFTVGVVGQAVHTGTPSSLRYATGDSILRGAAGTIEFWLNPDWNGNQNSTHAFFEAGDNFNNGMLLAIDGANNLRFIQWGDDPTTPTVELGVERGVGVSGVSWIANQWHHLAATWNGTERTMAFYVDGQLAGTIDNGVTIGNFSGSFFSIGSETNGGNPAAATFDEFRISNRARSTSEILADFASGISYSSLVIGIPNSTTIHLGAATQLTATASDAFGVTHDVTSLVHWTSSSAPAQTVHITSDGRLVVEGTAGSFQVSAAFGSLSSTSNLTAEMPPGPSYRFANVGATHIEFDRTSYDFVVEFSDSDGIDARSLGLGDVRVHGPNGFSAFPTLESVDNNSNGTPRQATYRLTPPGGYWDPSDNGTYQLEIKNFQVRDIFTNSADANLFGDAIQVTVDPPRDAIVPAGELTEGNASNWTTFADGATATVVDDTTNVVVGSQSLRFDTLSGFDTGIRLAAGNKNWDLSSFQQLEFWTNSVNDTPIGFQGNQPIVVLHSPTGSFRFTPAEQDLPNHGWKKHHVPLGSDNYWVRESIGSPDLANVDALEIHLDTWDSDFRVYFDGVQFTPRNVNDPPAPGPQPPTGLEPGEVVPRVLLYVFDPIMENHGGQRLHQVYGWGDPVQLTHDALADLTRSSHGMYQPEVVQTVIADVHPYFQDGFQNTDQSFDTNWANRDFHSSSGFDYARFIRENDLAAKVDRGEFDEVWIYAPPIGGMYESVMAGEGAYWINGPTQVAGQHVFPIMGLNYERGVGEAIHSFGHRVENTVAHAYDSLSALPENAWRRFTRIDRDAPGQGGVGNVHFPVNALSDYDYDNARNVTSNADDWYSYPNFTGSTRSLNSSTWTPTHQDPQREYLNWWYDHMPHVLGRGLDDRLMNWWRYIGDLDAFKGNAQSFHGADGSGKVWLSGIATAASLSGIVPVTGESIIDGVVGRMDFYVDGVYQSSDTLAPFTFQWDTSQLVSGSHSLELRAYDVQNETETRSIPLEVTTTTDTVNVSIAVAPSSVAEDDVSDLMYTFKRTGNTDSALTVNFTVSGAATYNSDYSQSGAASFTATTGTVTFAANATTAIVAIVPVTDSGVEPTETAELSVTSGSGYMVASTSTAIGSILNDDHATLSIAAPTTTESNVDKTVNFAVTLDHAVQGGFDLAIGSTDGSAGSTDYTLSTRTLHFTGIAGESHDVLVAIKGDTIPENNETFSISLGAVTGTTGTQAVAITHTASATATIINDDLFDLSYSGTGNTVVTVSVLTSGPLSGHLQVKLGTVIQADVDPAFVRSLAINGGSGIDVIDLTGLSHGVYSRLTSIRLNGNAGNDRITGSNEFNETISGGTGNDVLNGGAGGADRLVESAVATSTTALSLTLSNTTLTGGFGSDAVSNFEEASLTGAAGADVLKTSAFSGQATLIGNGGVDQLTGGGGNDSLDGGVGNDVLVGGAGNDVLSGGVGSDKLTGGSGNDQLLGGTESDTVFGSGATTYELTDSTLTGDGTDTLSGIEAASLTLLATETAAGRIDASRFTGSGKNTLTGGGGADVILGGSGPDSINGGGGNDLLTGGLGNDSLNGGTGTDRLRESGNVNFALTNSTLTGLGTDAITSSTIELVELTGGVGDNRLNASAFTFGSVTLNGGDGNDVLLGGGKADSLIGGTGRDLLVGGVGIDNLTGRTGDDILIGGTIASTIKTTAALTAIMAEWTSGNSLADRKAHLVAGGGVNGTNKLTTTTVLNDSSAADRLTGNEDLDWFFQLASDVLVDFNAGAGDIRTP